VAAALVVADLWSKSAVFALLRDPTTDLVRDVTGHYRYLILGNWLAFMENLNYGAAFGQLADLSWALVPLRAVALLVVSVLILRAPAREPLYLSALVLVLAGAAGNLYDNLFNGPLFQQPGRPFGPVRDFIDVYFERWQYHFATFNVADSCITVGAVLLILSGLGGSKRKQEASAPQGEGT